METMQRAIIVAAGEGTRLRPVTEETPKPLIKVNGTRLIDNSIAALKKNAICEIYIVAGYKKEQFEEYFADDPQVQVIENPYYKQGNNITSMYVARNYLPGAFVIEGDLKIEDDTVFVPQIEKSAYCATYLEDCPEWALKVENGRIISCNIAGEKNAYRNLGISMWTKEDGEKLARLIEEQIEVKKDWSIYWDEIALFSHIDEFDIGIRLTDEKALTEIDTVEELAALDPSYKGYLK